MEGRVPNDLHPLSPLQWVIDSLRSSIVYFTRLPAGSSPISPEAMKWAAAHLPAVGAAIGAASAIALATTASLGQPLSAAVALTTSVLLTGAIHEDGLADTADALGAGHSGKNALEILRDSHVGAFGVVAVGLSLLLRFASLTCLSADRAYLCVIVHCMARLPPVWLLSSVAPPEGRQGAPGTASRMAVGWRPVAVACCWAAGLCAILLWQLPLPLFSVLSASIICLAVFLFAARKCRKTFGGLTGDVLGATEQVSEICLWVGFLAGDLLFAPLTP